MSTEPIVVAESLGGSALSRAARAGELGEWYRARPVGDEWRRYTDDVRKSVSPSWHDELAPAIAAYGRAAARLRRSAAGAGIVVTTGQQPGLFGGPLMTLIKAATARALADALEEALGTPVAPVFWAATDDADFDEAAVVSVALDGGARELRLTHRGPAGTPMARVPLDGAEIAALAPWLREACGTAPHTSYLERALTAYRSGATVGGAYVETLRELLEPLEIAVLDASHPSLIRVAAPLLERAAADAAGLAAAVRRRSEEIVARGFVPQVDDVEGLSLVFCNSSGLKRRLPIDESPAWSAHDDSFLSPTVLLRPVLERMLLPSAAYIGGPAEVAYFAQVAVVAAALNVPVPLILPRWSATIIEPRVRRILDAFDAEPQALADPHGLERRVARQRMPAGAADALEALRRELVAGVESLRAADPALLPGRVLDGLGRSIQHRLARVERRLLAAIKRRESDAMHQIGTARGSLYPHGVRQERRLAYVPFLARYGPPLIDQLVAGARAHARSLVQLDTRTLARDAVPAVR